MRLLLRVPEAAEALGIGRSKLLELVATGKLDSVKIGRRRLISVAALERYIEDLQAGGSALDGDGRS